MSAGVLGVCLVLAASLPPGAEPSRQARQPAGTVFVAQAAFTLAWTHSIEKTRWEEDYRVQAGPRGQPHLQLLQARIRGTGAGMEPPSDAHLRNGWYDYKPRNQPQGALRLTRSRFTPDFAWCVHGRCQPMTKLLPSDGDVTLLWPCRGPAPQR